MTINNIEDLAEYLDTTVDQIEYSELEYHDYSTTISFNDARIVIKTTANEYDISESKELNFPFSSDDYDDAIVGLQCWADAVWCEERHKEQLEDEYWSFVASLTYGEEMEPITEADAQYTMDQWAEEGSVEIPEGFTAKDFARIWNKQCPRKTDPETAQLKESDPEDEAAFTGKSGATITITRYGVNDYSATWNDEYSVRGTLQQVLEELKEEV